MEVLGECPKKARQLKRIWGYSFKNRPLWVFSAGLVFNFFLGVGVSLEYFLTAEKKSEGLSRNYPVQMKIWGLSQKCPDY